MFSLITTIISIALVAALALATLYYGGDAFNKGSAQAQAAKVNVQAQQIQGAGELYKVDFGVYPLNLQVLVDHDYLKSIPVAGLSASPLVSQALAASSWVMVAPRTPVYALNPVDLETCKSINESAFGVANVLMTARDHARLQCVGTDPANLMVIQAKSSEHLVAAAVNEARVIDLGTILSDPIPAAEDTSAAGWLIKADGSLNNGSPGGGEVTPPALPSVAVRYLIDGEVEAPSFQFQPTTVGDVSFGSVYVVVPGGSFDTIGSLGITEVSVAGASPFAVLDESCTKGTHDTSGFCWVDLAFTPGAARTYSGGYALQVKASKAFVTNQLSLSGEGLLPLPNASFAASGSNGANALTALDFASVEVGQALDRTVELWNSGAAALEFNATALSASSPFSVKSTTCSGQLAASTGCSVVVTFAPTAQATYSGASYHLAVNASNGTAPTLLLSGAGTQPAPVQSVLFYLQGAMVSDGRSDNLIFDSISGTYSSLGGSSYNRGFAKPVSYITDTGADMTGYVPLDGAAFATCAECSERTIYNDTVKAQLQSTVANKDWTFEYFYWPVSQMGGHIGGLTQDWDSYTNPAYSTYLGAIPDASVTTKTWNHVAISYSATEGLARTFVNGVLVANVATASPYLPDLYTVFGGPAGAYDEVRLVLNRKLTTGFTPPAPGRLAAVQ